MILKKYASYLWAFLSVGLLCIFLIFSSTASDSAKNGIILCFNVIAPTLFPMLVINGLLVSSGAASKIAGILSFPVQKLFGVSKAGVYPVVMGIVCGAPSGSIALSNMLENEKISNEEASVIAVTASPISFSFLYATVGSKMLGDYRLGIALFFICVLSGMLAGRILSIFFKPKMKEQRHFPSLMNSNVQKPFSFGAVMANAASSIISVCGAVVFFSAVSGVICSVNGIPFFLKAAAVMLLEISSGAKIISEHMTCFSAFLYLCAGVGWSGVSIICQCLSAVRGGISVSLFLIGKCLSSLLCLLLGMTALAFGLF